MPNKQHRHLSLIPETVEAKHAGMVTISAADPNHSEGVEATLSLMLYSRQARELRDALNAMDLDTPPAI